MIALVQRSLARIRSVFAAVAGVLMAFQIALIAVAASFTASNSFEDIGRIKIPRFLLHSFGMGELSFAGATTFGYYDPLVVMMLVQFAIYAGSEPAGDVESSLVDLMMARPLSRSRFVTRSVVVVTIVSAMLTAATGIGTLIGLVWLAPPEAAWPSGRTVGVLLAHLLMLSWAFGCVSLAAAAWSRRRGATQALVAVGVIAIYLVDIVGESWERARPFARLLPFHYYHGPAIVQRSANIALDLSIFAAIGAGALAMAYWRFGSRDL